MTTDEIKLLIQSLQDQIKQSQEVENEVVGRTKNAKMQKINK